MLSALFNAAKNDTLSVSLGLKDHKKAMGRIGSTPDRAIQTKYDAEKLLA